MLQRIEDITVLSTDEFLAYEGEMIFVDTECPFRSQPLTQVFIALGKDEETLPTMWQESILFCGDVFTTFEGGILHTFLSLDLQDQFEPGYFIFIKVIAIGEPDNAKPFRIV